MKITYDRDRDCSCTKYFVHIHLRTEDVFRVATIVKGSWSIPATEVRWEITIPGRKTEYTDTFTEAKEFIEWKITESFLDAFKLPRICQYPDEDKKE